jgi:hypothetical protein
MFQMLLSTALAPLVVLAHQGGWDELLMVIVPVGVFAALLYVANKRAAKLGDGAEPGATSHLGQDIDVRNPRHGPR